MARELEYVLKLDENTTWKEKKRRDAKEGEERFSGNYIYMYLVGRQKKQSIREFVPCVASAFSLRSICNESRQTGSRGSLAVSERVSQAPHWLPLPPFNFLLHIVCLDLTRPLKAAKNMIP